MAERKRINSVRKTLNILECFSRETAELKLTEISKLLDIPKSTTANLVYTLVDMGYLEQNTHNSKYRLGSKLFALGKIYENKLNVTGIIRSYLINLRDQFNETVNFVIPYGLKGLLVDQIESSNAIRLHSRIGEHIALHCSAAGKIFLSALSDEELEETLKKLDLHKETEYTITDINVLREELKNVRKNGYAISPQEREIGLFGIGVPLYDSQKNIVGVVAIAGPVERMQKKIKEQMIDELLKMSQEVLSKLNQI